ncbi:MAG: fasciclin domain-containing protein [Myxococcota bacterium]
MGGGEMGGDEAMPEDTAGAQDIVATASAAGQFSTLVAAVQAAELVETLQGPGPFTVFAPTDDAFAALDEGTVENLLLPENRDQLRAILTYHVVSGDVRAEQVMGMSSATTVQGQDLSVSTEGGSVRINNATVVQADIECSNGVIHVIDSVLLPPAS